jgi:hypothetical protein
MELAIYLFGIMSGVFGTVAATHAFQLRRRRRRPRQDPASVSNPSPLTAHPQAGSRRSLAARPLTAHGGPHTARRRPRTLTAPADRTPLAARGERPAASGPRRAARGERPPVLVR